MHSIPLAVQRGSAVRATVPLMLGGCQHVKAPTLLPPVLAASSTTACEEEPSTQERTKLRQVWAHPVCKMGSQHSAVGWCRGSEEIRTELIEVVSSTLHGLIIIFFFLVKDTFRALVIANLKSGPREDCYCVPFSQEELR